MFRHTVLTIYKTLKMKSLRVFCPENDIALGAVTANFTPPRNAMLLQRHGAHIMSWIADDGDSVLVESPCRSWNEYVNGILQIDIQLAEASPAGISAVKPWGWSEYLVKRLAARGVARELMPNSVQLARIRQLSHRRSSIIINNQLASSGFDIPNYPVEFSSIAAFKQYLSDERAYVIKSPWSSSGRGVFFSSHASSTKLLTVAAGIIKHQGSVIVEKMLPKTADFAMLFDIKNGTANYVGLSLFDTSGGSNYSGNTVASQELLYRHISSFVGSENLDRLKTALSGILSRLIGDSYSGICGIDMMVSKDNDGKFIIVPCVELNLRYTMGYVAYKLGERVLAPGKTAFMEISYINKTGKTVMHENESAPVFDENHKLCSGSIPLIPANEYFAMTLTVNS